MGTRTGLIGVLALVVGGVGCNTAVDCPVGTAEADGECVDNIELSSCMCGDSTHYDNVLLACVPDYPSVVCGVGTIGEINSDGINVCKRAPEGTPTVTRVIGAESAAQPGGVAMPGTQQASACCVGDSESKNGVCVASHAETICDPATTLTADTDSGVQVCQPIDPGSCPSVCNNPDPGNVTLCGQILDIETNRPLGADAGSYCDPANPTATGPCSLETFAYDALSFATDSSIPPLPAASIQINECGEFAVHNVPRPSLGFLAVTTDDSSKGSADDYVLTGIALQAASGERVTGLRLYATSRVTDAKWTASAGDPFGGPTFSERGAVFMLFLDQNDQPLPGVRPNVNGSFEPASTYYFSDTDPSVRSSVDPAGMATGPNGAALLVDTDLVNHGGVLAGCNFIESLAKSIPGAIFATERECE